VAGIAPATFFEGIERVMHRLLLAAVLATAAMPVPAQVRLALGDLTDGVPASKSVRTLRDLRYRDMVRQQYDFSCGSAALASLLRYGYGVQVDESHMIRSMLAGNDPREVVRNGFSMLDMKRYVEAMPGFRAHGFRVDADALHRLQMPVIALLDLKGYRHFVLVKGAAGGRVFVADPALGHRVMPEREFVAAWNGIVLAVVADRPVRADSFLVTSRSSPALQRRVDALDRATSPPRVVEFGLVAADLF
jgi:predicted double-glycine peptidase